MPRGSIPNRERPATSVWHGAMHALGRTASSGPIVRRMQKMSRDLRARHWDDRAELRASVAHRRRCRRASKAKSKCWVTEPKCRAGCDCRKELYWGPEGLGAYHLLLIGIWTALGPPRDARSAMIVNGSKRHGNLCRFRTPRGRR